MENSAQQNENTTKSTPTKGKVPPPVASSINTEDSTTSSSTAMLIDELDYFCDFLFQGGKTSDTPVSPLLKKTLSRQRRDRQALVQKRRMLHTSNKNIPNDHKRRAEPVVPANQKRVRVADTLLFINEGHVIGEEDLSGSVRTLHATKKNELPHEDADGSADEPPNDDGDGPQWYHSRRLWAGVAVAAVAVAAVVIVRRKR